MIKLILKEPGYFRDKPIIGLPEGYYIDSENRGYNRTKSIKLFKNSNQILHVTHRFIDFKGIHLIGDKFNGGVFLREDAYKYHKDGIDIKFIKLPKTHCPLLFHPIYIIGYINGKKIIFARSGKGISGFFEPLLNFSCTSKLFDYIDDKDAAFAIATIVWWLMYEQDED